MAKLLLHAHSVEGLRDVDSILHDAGFSMAEVAHDKDLGVVTIPFHPFPTRDVVLLRRHPDGVESDRREGHVLQVSGVSAIEIRDPDGLVEHSYSRLRMQEDSQLSLVSNFPGGIDMYIAEIDVKVFA